MERTFALIKGTTVDNHIVADDNFIKYIEDQYDQIIETTNMDPKPNRGHSILEDGSFGYFSAYSIKKEHDEIIEEPTITE